MAHLSQDTDTSQVLFPMCLCGHLHGAGVVYLYLALWLFSMCLYGLFRQRPEMLAYKGFLPMAK